MGTALKEGFMPAGCVTLKLSIMKGSAKLYVHRMHVACHVGFGMQSCLSSCTNISSWLKVYRLVTMALQQKYGAMIYWPVKMCKNSYQSNVYLDYINMCICLSLCEPRKDTYITKDTFVPTKFLVQYSSAQWFF